MVAKGAGAEERAQDDERAQLRHLDLNANAYNTFMHAVCAQGAELVTQFCGFSLKSSKN